MKGESGFVKQRKQKICQIVTVAFLMLLCAHDALADCYTEIDQDFTNGKAAPGWEHFLGGPVFPSSAGYALSSNHPGESSRIRWCNPFVLKGKETSFRITINMRGDPDIGKNSYAVLREEACAEGDRKNCDEIDITEIYGNTKAEAMWYGRSNGDANDSPTRLGLDGNPVSYDASSPGFNHHTYSIYYEQATGKIELSVDGQIKVSRYTWIYTFPMYLYLGIWDYRNEFPGPISSMDFAHVKIERCMRGTTQRRSAPREASPGLDHR